MNSPCCPLSAAFGIARSVAASALSTNRRTQSPAANRDDGDTGGAGPKRRVLGRPEGPPTPANACGICHGALSP